MLEEQSQKGQQEMVAAEKEKSKRIREAKKRGRELDKQRGREEPEKLKQEHAREEQERIEAQRLKELTEKKKQRIREEKERKKEAEMRYVKELERERLKQEKLEGERAEQERLRMEKLELERLQRLQDERLEQLRLEEEERLETERLMREREKQTQKTMEKALKEEELRREQKRERLIEKHKEDKARERLMGERLKGQEKLLPTIQQREARAGREPTRESKAVDRQERGRAVKRRLQPDITTGPYRTPDPIPKRQRTRGGGKVTLANMFEAIVNILSKSKVAFFFVKPVSKKEAPDYLDIVKKPMDLSLIREKARKLRYKCRDDFRMDVEQIVTNVHEYNDGRNPGIPPLADALLDLCDLELRTKKVEMEDAEDAVERFDDDDSYTSNGPISPPLSRRRRQRGY